MKESRPPREPAGILMLEDYHVSAQGVGLARASGASTVQMLGQHYQVFTASQVITYSEGRKKTLVEVFSAV